MPTSRASDATRQSRSGCRCISVIALPIWRSCKAAIHPRAPEFYARVGRNPDLQARLDRLEQQLAEMGGADSDAGGVSEPPDHQTLLDALHDQLLGPNRPPTPPKLADIFSEDRGSSQWGEANIARVRDEYAQEPWIQQYGGEFTTQCRQTSCKVEWVVPTVEADDHAFALAEYELMAAATRNTDQIGRVQTERRTEDGRTVISVYLERR